MKNLHVTIDLETASLKSNAAIIQIAAVAWDVDAKTMKKRPSLYDGTNPYIFNEHADLCTCLVNGLDFDHDTIQWWASQSDEAKANLVDSNFELVPIKDMIIDFYEWIRATQKAFHADEVIIWAQGTDSDIAILRTVSQILGIKDLPWEYFNVRDSRTFIKTMCELMKIKEDSEVFNMPRDENFNTFVKGGKHNALYDALQTTWNVFVLHFAMKNKLFPVNK